jgi:hypothetical protein
MIAYRPEIAAVYPACAVRAAHEILPLAIGQGADGQTPKHGEDLGRLYLEKHGRCSFNPGLKMFSKPAIMKCEKSQPEKGSVFDGDP